MLRASFRSRVLPAALAVGLVFVSVLPLPAARFIRGDADGAGGVAMADAVAILQSLFGDGGALLCAAAADANDNGRVELGDAIAVLRAAVLDGAGLPAPFPGCGADPSDDALDCQSGSRDFCGKPAQAPSRGREKANSASRGSWQFRLEQLNIGAAGENGLLSDGDEPYLVMIGFSSKFGVRDSTRTYRNDFAHEYWSGLDRPDSVAIPPEMGVIDFGEVDDGSLGIAGVVVVAMESDASPWGAIGDLFDEAERATKLAVRRLVEANTLTLTDPAMMQSQIAKAVSDITDAVRPSVSEAAGIFIESWGDVDNMVGIDRKIWVLGLNQFSSSGIETLAERVYTRGSNPLNFDGTGVDSRMYGGGLYSVYARLTSTVLRVGDLVEPRSRRSYWQSVPLTVTFCPGCHPVSQVFYHATYDPGDGLGLRKKRIAIGDPANGYGATWDIRGVTPQEEIPVVAEFVSNSFGGSVESDPHLIDLNVDRDAPYGRITLPENKSVHGRSMRLAAEVGDFWSGVDRVEFSVETAQGTLAVPQHGTAANGFSVTWSCASVAEQSVKVWAEVYDLQGNHGRIGPVPEVVIEHTPPAVESVYPSPDYLQKTWIMAQRTTMLRARASDSSGVSELRFTAYYRDAAGRWVSRPVGTAPRINDLGEFSVAWDVGAIADYADRGFPHGTFIDATAVDSAGNEGFATGWIAGFDRAAPTVRVTRPYTAEAFRGDSFPVTVEAEDAVGLNRAVVELSVTASYRSPKGLQTTLELARLRNARSWSGTFSVPGIPEQTVSVTAAAVDESGQRSFHAVNAVFDRTAPVISGIRHALDPFLANGTTATSVLYQLSERASVTLRFSSAAAGTVREFVFADVYTDPQAVSWNGRDKFGNVVPSGVYSYSFDATDRAGNTRSVLGGSFNVVRDTTPPVLTLVVAPNPYSLSTPKVDIRYSQNEPARAEIEILDGSSVIKYLGAWQEAAGIFNRTWNGLNAAGLRVPAPRTYTVRLRVVDSAGNMAITTASLQVVP